MAKWIQNWYYTQLTQFLTIILFHSGRIIKQLKGNFWLWSKCVKINFNKGKYGRQLLPGWPATYETGGISTTYKLIINKAEMNVKIRSKFSISRRGWKAVLKMKLLPKFLFFIFWNPSYPYSLLLMIETLFNVNME